MSARRRLFPAVILFVGLLGLLLVWPTSRNQVGGLSVTFISLTNDNSGKMMAQFSIANHFSRRVRCGVCEVQLCQTNGWPNAVRVAGGADWLPVATGSERVFSVPTPPPAGVNWRVPLVYQEDLSLVDNLRFRADLRAWGIARWHPGKPLPVRHGDGFHRNLFTYGPEMLEMLNPHGGVNGRQPVRSGTNQTSAATGSGR